MDKHLSLLLMLTGVCFMDCQSTGKPGHLSYPMESISNEGKTKEEPYLTAGDKAHIIGTQNGLFPDMGGHVPGEMGGIWTHPVKLADGYWMKIREEGQQEGVWLMEAEEYITYPYGSGFLYNQNDLQVKRFQFAPDQEKGVIIEYTIQNTSGQVRNLFLDFVVKTDLSPVWFSKENGIPDYPDQVIWDTHHQLFSARDSLQE